jgi:PilZ domain
MTLRGRYMLADGREYECRTVDISAGGIAILGVIKGKIGERVVVYLDEVGRVEGRIVRHFGGCFAIELSVTELKRDWLNLQISRLLKRRSERSASGASHS